MRKIVCIVSLLVLVAGCGYDTRLTEAEQWWLEPKKSETHIAFERDGKWGFRDRSGNVIIEPCFDYAVSFPGSGDVMVTHSSKVVHYEVLSSPIGRVRIGEKWGYIDGSGKVVVRPAYDAALDFFEDLTAVKVGDKWGYIDRKGNVVIAPQYELSSPFLLGVAHVKDHGNWYVIDRNNKKSGQSSK